MTAGSAPVLDRLGDPLPAPPPQPADVDVISLARAHYCTIISHAWRKLSSHYIDGETPERKAFGLLAGQQVGSTIETTAVFPLLVNRRQDPRHRAQMDRVVGAHAIPSETPLDQRGWLSDPPEVMAVDRACPPGSVLFGNYHTHRVAWPDDPRRDSCTRLDRELAADSGQWVFILSVVDLGRPLLRAYYEGDNHREARIRLLPDLTQERT